MRLLFVLCLAGFCVSLTATEEEPATPRVRLAGCKTCAVLLRNVCNVAEGVCPVQPAINPCGNQIGVRLLLEGNADIAITCRTPKQLAERFNFVSLALDKLEARPFAHDGYCLIVNKNNPIKNVQFEDLSLIYRGIVTNWAQIGGADIDIWAYRHDPRLGSGLALFFQEKTIGLDGEFSPRVKIVQSPRITAKYVRRHEEAFGYASFSDVPDGVKVVAVDGVIPTVEGIRKGEVPCSVTYHLITLGEPTGVSADYIEFITSARGQALIDRFCFSCDKLDCRIREKSAKN